MRRTMMRCGLVVAALAALFFAAIGASARAQSLSGEAFLAAIDRGAVWCVNYQAADQSCTFILRRPLLTLVSEGPITEAVGLSMFELEDGRLVKNEHTFRYFVREDMVCLSSAAIVPDDIKLYSPATTAPEIVEGDRRLPSDIEGEFRRILVSIWAQTETTCWSYQLAERVAELRGLEIVMARRDGLADPVSAGFGAFFETEDAKRLRLRP